MTTPSIEIDSYNPEVVDLTKVNGRLATYQVAAIILGLGPTVLWHNILKNHASLGATGFKLSAYGHFYAWMPFVLVSLMRSVNNNQAINAFLWQTIKGTTLAPWGFNLLAAYVVARYRDETNYSAMIGYTIFSLVEMLYTFILLPRLWQWHVETQTFFESQYLAPTLGQDAQEVDWEDTTYLNRIEQEQLDDFII